MSASLATDPRAASPKRTALLEAAGRLFLEQGYAAVSMDAVARGAGISKATLYAHFTGKEALFGAVVERRCAEMAERLEISTGHDRPLDQALGTIGRHILDFLLQPPVLTMFRIAMAEGHRFPDLARAYYAAGPKAGLDRLAGWMEEEARRGRLRPGADPRQAAEHFISMLRGTLLIRGALGIGPAPEAAELDRVAGSAARLIHRAYGAGAPE